MHIIHSGVLEIVRPTFLRRCDDSRTVGTLDNRICFKVYFNMS